MKRFFTKVKMPRISGISTTNKDASKYERSIIIGSRNKLIQRQAEDTQWCHSSW